MDTKGRIARSAGVISFATLMSRILGYVKDMIIARYFGASGISDTFFVAFRIPNLLRELFAEGSMSSALIPVLTESQTKSGQDAGKQLIRIVFTFVLIAVGSLCVIGIIFTPQIITLIAPGFTADHEKFSQTVLLTRVMFPFLLFISLAAVVMGALNTRRIFFIPALAPAILNITIIAAVVVLASNLGQPIIAVAVGVTLGGLVQYLFQLPSFFRNGYDLRPSFQFSHPGLKRMSVLIMPATMGMAVAQVNLFINTILASYLPEGSITYIYYAVRLIQFPIGLFGVAIGMAVLPSLSEHAARGDMGKLREDFSFSLRLLFFITVPAMIGLIILREPIVNILFQRGEFDYPATTGTADALLFFSLGIWAIVGVRIVTAAFYSLQDTKTPVKVACIAMVTNVVMSFLLMGPLKHAGLAFAYSIASSINFIILFYFLRRRLGSIDTGRILRSFAKISAASAIMGFTGQLLLRGDLWMITGRTAEKALYLSGAIFLSVGIYLAVSFILKGDEMHYFYGKLRERLRGVRV